MKRIVIITVLAMILSGLVFGAQCWALGTPTISFITISPLEVTAGERFSVYVKVEYVGDEIDEVEIKGLSSTDKTIFSNKIFKLEGNREVYLFGTLSAGLHEVSKIEVITKNNGTINNYTTNLGKTFLVKAISQASTPDPVITPQNPLLSVTSVTFSPSTPNINEPFYVNVHFKNDGYGEALNVVAAFDGGKNFEVLDLTNKVTFSSVWYGNTRTASFRVRAKSTRESNSVNMSFTYNGGSDSETLNLPLDAVAIPQNEPFLKIGTFTIEPQGKDGDFLLRVQLKNLGGAEAKNISVEFEPSQAFPRESSNVVYIPQLAGGAVREVAVKMAVSSKNNNVYAVPITISYSGAGTEKYTGSEVLTVTAVSLGLINVEEEKALGMPRVMLSKYTLSEDQILAGNTVRLTLFIENSSNRVVRNIKASLSVKAAGTTTTSDVVFSPVNSSNSFYIESIGAKKTIIKDIDLYVDPNAPAKTHSLDLDIEYEDSEGKPYNVTEMVNIPVTQESRLQVLAVEAPPMGAVGQPVPVSAQFVNVGKVALKNFMISIEGDFQKENASYFLPSLEIGMEDYFMGMIIPQSEGLLSGIVVFSYIDNTNREVRIEKPFEVNVQQMDFERPDDKYPPDFYPPDGRYPGGGKRFPLLWLVSSLIIIAGGAFIAVKKVRARRMEIFDEEL